jgi:hypothetical protein
MQIYAQRPCRTKYILDYYPRDQLKQLYGRGYNTEYNAKFVTTLCYREYSPQGGSDSDSAIPSYTTTITIDDYKSTSEPSPSNEYSLPGRMRFVVSGATIFYDEDDRTGIATTTATITVPEVQERSTVRYIHQLRRLAAASAPRDESTSVLRERR